MSFTRNGGAPANAPSPTTSTTKKPFFKKWWFWLIIAIIILGAIGSGSGSETEKPAVSQTSEIASNVNSEQEASMNDSASKSEEASEPDIPAEYKSALRKADTYANDMHMSKAGLYNQLTSEYGEQFSAEAAQYAIDNVQADWNKNALEKARIYQNDMAMSPAAIYDQLVSEYGEQFTAEEAQYAIDNL